MVCVGNVMYCFVDIGVIWISVVGICGIYGQVVLLVNGMVLLYIFRNVDGIIFIFWFINFIVGLLIWMVVGGLGIGDIVFVVDFVNLNKFYVYDNGIICVSINGGMSFSVIVMVVQWGLILLCIVLGCEGDVWVLLNGSGLVCLMNFGSLFSVIFNVSYVGVVGFGKVMGGFSYFIVFIWGMVGLGKCGIYCFIDVGVNWVCINDDIYQFGGLGNGYFVVGDMNIEGCVFMSSVGCGFIYGIFVGGMLQVCYSGKCLDVLGYSSGFGIVLVQWICSGGVNQ